MLSTDLLCNQEPYQLKVFGECSGLALALRSLALGCWVSELRQRESIEGFAMRRMSTSRTREQKG